MDGYYICESCGEEIQISIDLSAGDVQEYVEDCPVCCCPNLIQVKLDDEGAAQVFARSEQDLN